VAEVTVEVPAEWRGLESEFDPEAVQGVAQGKGDGPWLPVTVRLARPTKQPFTVVLLGTVAVPPGAGPATVPLLRFPKAVERDASVTRDRAEGLEVRGAGRGWVGDRPSETNGPPLAATAGADGRVPRVVASVSGRAELGLAAVACVAAAPPGRRRRDQDRRDGGRAAGGGVAGDPAARRGRVRPPGAAARARPSRSG
jgi:hypothetical protein